MSVTDSFVRNNREYAENFDEGELELPPAKTIAIVTCMDARMNIGGILGLSLGDAHILRNAGGIVTDDVIRSLIVSQRILGTSEIMVIHHTDCGMTTLTDDGLKEEIYRDTGLRPPFAIEAFSDLDDDVRQSVARIKASPYIPHKDKIRGFVYEIETGRLREVPI